jgi:hypothetical protein
MTVFLGWVGLVLKWWLVACFVAACASPLILRRMTVNQEREALLEADPVTRR